MKKLVKRNTKFRFHLEFIIKSDIYPSSVLVSIGNEGKQLVDVLAEYNKMESHLEVFKRDESIRDCDGGCLISNGIVFLHVKDFPTTPKSKANLAHEIFHCCSDMMEYIGAKHDNASEEPYAYLISWLTQSIYTEIDKYYDANSERISRLTKNIPRTA